MPLRATTITKEEIAPGRGSRVFLLALVFIMSFFAVFASTNAHADSVDPSVNIGTGDSTVAYLVSESNKVAGFDVMAYDSNTGILSFSSTEYSKLSLDERQTVMKEILSGIKKSDLTPERKNTMYNFVAERDGAVSSTIRMLSTDAQADLAKASGLFQKYASQPISLTVGILVLLTFVFLTFSTAVDIFFLTIPPFQALITSSENKKPFYITNEAWKANKAALDSIGSGGYKDAVGQYIKLRLFAFIVVPIILILLVTGEFWTILLKFIPF